MKSKRILVALIAAVMAFSLCACNSGLALYVNVKAGESYKYQVKMEQTMDMEQSGQKITTDQNMVFDFVVTVNEVDSEGNITADYKYDALKIDMSSNGSTQSFDSKNVNSDDPMSAIYNSFIGKGFTAKMTKYGEIKEISGIDNLLNSVVDSVDFGEAEGAQALKEQMKESLKQSFGDESIKSAVQSAVIFPDKGNIKAGDTWTVEDSVKSFVDINVTTTYTLDKIEGDTAYISVKADLKTDSSNSADYMGMDMTADFSGTVTGNIKVNIKNGFLSEGQITQEISGKMSLVIPAMEGIESQTIELPVDYKTTITYTTTRM